MGGHLRTMAHSQFLNALLAKFYVLDFWQMVTTEADESGIPICWEDHQFNNIPLGRGDVFVMIWRVATSSMDEVVVEFGQCPEV